MQQSITRATIDVSLFWEKYLKKCPCVTCAFGLHFLNLLPRPLGANELTNDLVEFIKYAITSYKNNTYHFFGPSIVSKPFHFNRIIVQLYGKAARNASHSPFLTGIHLSLPVTLTKATYSTKGKRLFLLYNIIECPVSTGPPLTSKRPLVIHHRHNHLKV